MIKHSKKNQSNTTSSFYDDEHLISTADISQIIAHEIGSKYLSKLTSLKNNKYFNENPLSAKEDRILSTQYAN
jgi:hypothetical protein